MKQNKYLAQNNTCTAVYQCAREKRYYGLWYVTIPYHVQTHNSRTTPMVRTPQKRRTGVRYTRSLTSLLFACLYLLRLLRS